MLFLAAPPVYINVKHNKLARIFSNSAAAIIFGQGIFSGNISSEKS